MASHPIALVLLPPSAFYSVAPLLRPLTHGPTYPSVDGDLESFTAPLTSVPDILPQMRQLCSYPGLTPASATCQSFQKTTAAARPPVPTPSNGVASR